MQLSQLRLIVGAAILLLSQSAFALDYPTKTIRLVVPYPPGGPADTLARYFAQHAAVKLGKPVVVDNMPGGNSIPAASSVAHAPKDGYTLLLTTAAPFSINPFLFSSLPYDPDKDFKAVGTLAQNYYFIYASPSFAPNNVAELIDVAKKDPGKINIVGLSQVSSTSFALKKLEEATGAKFTTVQYKGDSAAIPDLLSGRVDIHMTGMFGANMEYARAGKLKIIGSTGPTRSRTRPELETLAEFAPGATADAWFAVMAPAGTPAEIVARLNQETQAFASDPAMIDKLGMQGVSLLGGSAQDLEQLIASETANASKLIKSMNISPQ